MSARTRRYALLWHRYAGLFMAGFLALAGLTGSVLAFRDRIDRWLSPQLYATIRPGVPPLDLQTLAERANGLVPHARVSGVSLVDVDQAQVTFTADRDPATGKPRPLGFTAFYVDPWTGGNSDAATVTTCGKAARTSPCGCCACATRSRCGFSGCTRGTNCASGIRPSSLSSASSSRCSR